MEYKNKILLSIIGIVTVLLITIGLSYAYFSANMEGGEEATTITVTGGTMNIVYNGGADINVQNIIPKEEAISSKIFTVTGNNTMDIPMGYKINLIVDANTFSESALKYKLISTNTDNNGNVAPSINTLTNMGTGSKTIELGTGTFGVPTGGNKTHTYNLEIYFPNQDYNQNIDQGKEFKAHIAIENYIENRLKYKILAQGGGSEAIEAKGDPSFDQIATVLDSGLYASIDEYGTSYYYRGERDQLNNNLIFGGFQWKIIRINGDGSIRIIYNGTEEEFNTNRTMNTAGENTQIGSYSWNETYFNDAKYIGYMYGGNNGIASTSREEALLNMTNSNAKLKLENWYQTNLANQPFSNKIVDNIFCNDRQLQSEIGGETTGPGYGNLGIETRYATYYRLSTYKTPVLKCGQQNDRFTKNDTAIGNGKLIYPIGVINANEVAMSGLLWLTDNTTNYLSTGQNYWTSSPYHMSALELAGLFIITNTGQLAPWDVTGVHGLRPVINISSDVTVTGDGTETNPYHLV